jgi:acyl-[acyl-carrier-protein]-phospholipid O-acyltransferase/long-chain-fatty-acid--[acyl-carrier-protein] ligase
MIHALPVSEALGLTAGLLLPLLSGAETRFADFSGRDAAVSRAAPGATIVLGSDAFLTAYGEATAAVDAAQPRAILVEAGSLRAETLRLWSVRAGMSVLEAFGGPQAAGAIAAGSLTHNRPGSAGRLLPGMEIRLEAIQGLADGGRLWISGPNVMLGIMRSDAPGILQPPLAGWHDTGEAVSTDREGFFTRLGRADRIAPAKTETPEARRPQGKRARAA